jgi:hypothetical protein
MVYLLAKKYQMRVGFAIRFYFYHKKEKISNFQYFIFYDNLEKILLTFF